MILLVFICCFGRQHAHFLKIAHVVPRMYQIFFRLLEVPLILEKAKKCGVIGVLAKRKPVINSFYAATQCRGTKRTERPDRSLESQLHGSPYSGAVHHQHSTRMASNSWATTTARTKNIEQLASCTSLDSHIVHFATTLDHRSSSINQAGR